MGRYYSGDIDGKFWFGLQSSLAADRFGVSASDPGYVEYYFDNSNLTDVQEELKNIELIIGSETLTKLKDFWSKTNSYNDDILKENGMFYIWEEHGKNYADYILGKKIEKCIIDQGECSFTAEL